VRARVGPFGENWRVTSMSTRELIRHTARAAGLSVDDDRVEELAPLMEHLQAQLETLRALDPDGVDQLEPAFTFHPTAWTNQPR
jgi:hypothetical protein